MIQIILGIGFIVICYYIAMGINQHNRGIELAMREIQKGKTNNEQDYIFVNPDEEDIGGEHAGLLAENEEEEEESLFW